MLIDSVATGASVGWVDPPTTEDATAWWAALFADPDAETWVAHAADTSTFVTARGSRVAGRGSRVAGRGSRVALA